MVNESLPWVARIEAGHGNGRAPGVNVFVFDTSLAAPRGERALVLLHGPERLPFHAVRRLFRACALPALDEFGTELARWALEWLRGLDDEGGILFATSGRAPEFRRDGAPASHFLFEARLHVVPARAERLALVRRAAFAKGGAR